MHPVKKKKKSGSVRCLSCVTELYFQSKRIFLNRKNTVISLEFNNFTLPLLRLPCHSSNTCAILASQGKLLETSKSHQEQTPSQVNYSALNSTPILHSPKSQFRVHRNNKKRFSKDSYLDTINLIYVTQDAISLNT